MLLRAYTELATKTFEDMARKGRKILHFGKTLIIPTQENPEVYSRRLELEQVGLIIIACETSARRTLYCHLK